MILRGCQICGALSDRTRCPSHRTVRPTAARRGYDARWRRTRARFLASQPVCQEPGCDRPATDVHHLDGLGPNGPLGHSWANLSARCHMHHSRITARSQPGGWATHGGAG